MSCVVMSTYVSMSIYVRCPGMSRRMYGSCENCVYKEGCLPCFVIFFSSCNLLYSIRNTNLVSVSSVSSVSTVSPYRQHSSSAARLCPTRPSDAVRLSVQHFCLTLSVLVRHVCPTLCISRSDTSVRRSPSPFPTRPSDVVSSCPIRPSDAIGLCLPFEFPFPFPFPFASCSRSHSHSIPIPFPVPPPPRFRSHSCLHHQNSLEYVGEPSPLHT